MYRSKRAPSLNLRRSGIWRRSLQLGFMIVLPERFVWTKGTILFRPYSLLSQWTISAMLGIHSHPHLKILNQVPSPARRPLVMYVCCYVCMLYHYKSQILIRASSAYISIPECVPKVTFFLLLWITSSIASSGRKSSWWNWKSPVISNGWQYSIVRCMNDILQFCVSFQLNSSTEKILPCGYMTWKQLFRGRDSCIKILICCACDVPWIKATSAFYCTLL